MMQIYQVKTEAPPPVVYKPADQFAIVHADGTCEIDWKLCEQAAADWKPHGDLYAAVAKLLMHARQQP